MSIIYGLYHKNQTGTGESNTRILSDLERYQCDKTGSYQKGPVFMVCSLHCITPESLQETLPYEDKEASLVITADAIIDNREELFKMLSRTGEKHLPDSPLILEAYKKWGIHCPEKLAGDFAFAIWDEKKQELFCARDHKGRKTLYYHTTSALFAFSTLLEPLLNTKGIKNELNETYIADFLAISGVIHEINSETTIYKNIFSLPPAHSMLVSKERVKRWRYWELKKTTEIKFDTDAEYEAAFREIYSEAVRCRLRCIKDVGILLSGGLQRRNFPDKRKSCSDSPRYL